MVEDMSILFSIIWCTKYRRKVLKDEVADDCKALLYSLAEEYRFEILAMEVMPDHIHLLLRKAKIQPFHLFYYVIDYPRLR